MADPAPLSAISAFGRLAVPAPREGAGVTVAEHTGLGVAGVIVLKGGEERFSSILADAFGIALLEGPRVSAAGELAFVGTGPRSFLALRAGGGWRFRGELAGRLGGVAAVSDQSSGYGVVRLSGPNARDALAKGVPLDLHPSAFLPADAAVTLADHVGIVLWQVDGVPTYDVAVPRSHAESFWSWLASSAAEFRLAVARPVTAPGGLWPAPPDIEGQPESAASNSRR